MSLSYKTVACSLLLGAICWAKPVAVNAQDGASRLKQQFRTYWQTQQPEKLYLHTDRTFYADTDTVWFKAYAIETQSGKLRREPETAFMSLTSPENRMVISRKLRLENGKADGILVLPDSLKSGRYTLQIYSSRQRQASPATFFRQEIYVNSAPVQASGHAGAKADQAIKHLEFYPESGKLLAGLESKVAFKALATDGSAVPAEGVVLDESGKIVTRFRSAANGVGSFTFWPQPGKTYAAQVQQGTGKHTFPLPVEEKGYAFSVKNRPDSVIVKLAARPENTGAPVRFTLQRHGNLLFSDTILYNFAGYRKLVFASGNWPEGLVQAAVLNAQGITEAERLFFRSGKQAALKLETTAKTYGRRAPVQLQFTALDANGKPLEGDFSVSVTANNRLSGASLRNTFLLNSELAETASTGNSDFLPAANLQDADLTDNLLLIRKALHFSWEKVAQTLLKTTPELIVIQTEPEAGTESDKAALTALPPKKNNAAPVNPVPAAPQEPELNEIGKTLLDGSPVSKAVIYFLETQTGNTYLATTDTAGKFKVPLVSSSKLFYQVWQNGVFLKNTTLQVLPEPTILAAFAAPDRAFLPDTAAIQKMLLQKRIEKVYGLNVKRPKHKIPVKDMWPTYAADKYYPLEEYNAFNNMEEIFREIVPNVRILAKNKVTETRVYNSDRRDFFPHQPLYIIDGQPTWNNDLFLRLDASQVEQVNVYYSNKSLAPFGFLGNQGVIAVFTKSANYQSPELKTEHILHVTAQSGEARFKLPEREAYEPDFRPTLYWDPAVRTDANGKASVLFPTSDETGEMLIRVEGVTKDGQFVSQQLVVPVQAGQ